MNFRDCSVCGSNSLEKVFTQSMHSITGIGDIGYQHQIHICQDCGFVMASPLLPDEQISRYYEFFSNYELHHSAGIHSMNGQRLVARQVELLSSRFEPDFKGRVLDIGCSVAFALSLFKEQGWDVIGIDPSDWCIRQSREIYGVEVRKGFISEDLLARVGTVDAIILSHVLEHLVYPDQALELIRSVLADGGVLFIEVPNLMNHTRLPGYFAFEHVNYFTPVSLTNLALRAGFQVDVLYEFDNAGYKSAYPVISATFRKTDKAACLVNDVEAAKFVIDDYLDHVPEIHARLNRRIQHAVRNTPTGRLAVWGAGIHTSQLLSDTVLGSVPLKCIYDNDPKKIGHALNGIPIKTFPTSPVEAKAAVDAILISSLASEDEIFKQLAPLRLHGIQIYRLYADDQHIDC